MDTQIDGLNENADGRTRETKRLTVESGKQRRIEPSIDIQWCFAPWDPARREIRLNKNTILVFISISVLTIEEFQSMRKN